MENLCCSICLSLSKKTINIYSTDLQYVYEKLANFELRDAECWVCYICHTRLRQCHQLQQLAVQTRGLIDDIFQNKIDFKFGRILPLLELSISKTKIISSYIEQDLRDKELYKDDGREEDKILDNTINHKVEEQTFIKSEDDKSSRDLANENNSLPESHEIKLVDISQIVNIYAPQNTTTLDKEDIECRTQSKYEQSTENLGIKQEIEEEIEDKGVNERDSTFNNKERDHKKEVLSVCHKQTLICDICHKIFTYRSQLISHLRSHTGEKPFKCNICSKGFALKMNLKRHFMFNHTGGRYSCDICSKRFAKAYYVKKHRLVHSDEKPFTCQTCSKTFSTLIQLTRHEQTHTSERLLSCDVCSKKFSNQSHLAGHKQTHTKPFSCSVCSEKFARNSALKRHMQTHTGEQPFGCNICLKRFTCKSSLEHHTLIHTGDKKHICHLCGKKFSLKRYLNSHLQTHMGIKQYSCDICYKEFVHKSSLNSHIKRVH